VVVRVDEARQQHASGQVDLVLAAREAARGTHGRNPTGRDREVSCFESARLPDVRVAQNQRPHAGAVN
jgi:hypothetical protein